MCLIGAETENKVKNDFFELVHQLRTEGVLSVGVLQLLKDNQRAFGQFAEELRDGRFKLSATNSDTLRDIYIAAGVSEELLEKARWDYAWKTHQLVYISGVPRVPLLREMREFGLDVPSYDFGQEMGGELDLQLVQIVSSAPTVDGKLEESLIGFDGALAFMVANPSFFDKSGRWVVALSGEGVNQTIWCITDRRLQSQPFKGFMPDEETSYLLRATLLDASSQ